MGDEGGGGGGGGADGFWRGAEREREKRNMLHIRQAQQALSVFRDLS